MAVIVSGARTPIGKFLGSLKAHSAVDLGGIAIKEAVARAGVPPEAVEYVLMGHVLQAGCGQMTARQAAVAAGLPMSVPAITLNKACLSGMNAIALADQLIRVGAHDVIVAGGMESMTAAPHILPGARQGYKYGDGAVLDHLTCDGLLDVYTHQVMGALTDSVNSSAGEQALSRDDQDAFAVRSHHKAAAAWDTGIFDDEVVTVPIGKPSDRQQFDHDEGIRPDASGEAMAKLRPAFTSEGTITAASASQLSDGACAVVVMSEEKAAALGVTPLAWIESQGMAAGPDSSLQMQPASAIRAACDNAGVSVSDLDVVEINEAFAAVGLASIRALDLNPEIVNVNGGAIALGHPVGMSGARLVLHLALELGRRGGGVGAAGLCGGGGQGEALVLRVTS